MIEIYYNQALPLFCQDIPSLDVTVTYDNVQLFEIVIFMMVMMAVESENRDGSVNPRSGDSTAHSTARGGSVSSTATAAAPNILSTKGSYFLQCEQVHPGGSDTASSDAGAGEPLHPRALKRWRISLRKTSYGPPGVQRTERKRERRQRRSSKVRSRSPDGSPGALTRQNSNRSDYTTGSVGSGAAGGSIPTTNRSSELIRRMLNIITHRYFDTRIPHAPCREDITPGVVSQTWELVLVSATQEELSDSPFAIQITPYIKPFVPTEPEQLQLQLQLPLKGEPGTSDSSTDLLDPESSSRAQLQLQLQDALSLREDGVFKNSWLYVDSHLGDSMKLFTIRTGFESLGVPLTTCPMHSLHKHPYCHPVVILYEGMLGG